MTYFHSSSQSPFERRDEASRILAMLDGLDLAGCQQNERNFLGRMRSDREQPISAPQLFWLRDLKDKYLDKPTGQEALFS